MTEKEWLGEENQLGMEYLDKKISESGGKL